MGEFIDKIKGATNEAIGKAKVVVGKETENPGMIAKSRPSERTVPLPCHAFVEVNKRGGRSDFLS